MPQIQDRYKVSGEIGYYIPSYTELKAIRDGTYPNNRALKFIQTCDISPNNLPKNPVEVALRKFAERKSRRGGRS